MKDKEDENIQPLEELDNNFIDIDNDTDMDIIIRIPKDQVAYDDKQ